MNNDVNFFDWQIIYYSFKVDWWLGDVNEPYRQLTMEHENILNYSYAIRPEPLNNIILAGEVVNARAP